MAASDVGIPEDIRDIVKEASSGLLSSLSKPKCCPRREMGDLLTDERKFFDEKAKPCLR